MKRAVIVAGVLAAASLSMAATNEPGATAAAPAASSATRRFTVCPTESGIFPRPLIRIQYGNTILGRCRAR